jgi:hypothetical protein
MRLLIIWWNVAYFTMLIAAMGIIFSIMELSLSE